MFFTAPSEDVHHGGFPGMGHAMHSPMNPALHPGMHSGMHPGMHPGMQSGMHPGMHPEGKSTPTMDHGKISNKLYLNLIQTFVIIDD